MNKILLILLCLPMIGFGQTKTHEEMMKLLEPIFNEISLEKKRSNYECIYGDCQNGYGIQAYWGWKYVGEFKEGDKFGKGYVESEDGSFSEGEGEWFPMTGYFKSTNRDGDIYEGEYWNGYKHGKGKLTYTDGTIKEGYWEKEKFIGQETSINPGKISVNNLKDLINNNLFGTYKQDGYRIYLLYSTENSFEVRFEMWAYDDNLKKRIVVESCHGEAYFNNEKLLLKWNPCNNVNSFQDVPILSSDFIEIEFFNDIENTTSGDIYLKFPGIWPFYKLD